MIRLLDNFYMVLPLEGGFRYQRNWHLNYAFWQEKLKL